MRGPKFPINLEQEELETLQKITRKHSEKSSIVLRAKMILMANAGEKYQDIAQQLESQAAIIRHWAKRWYDMRDKPVRERLQRPSPTRCTRYLDTRTAVPNYCHSV